MGKAGRVPEPTWLKKLKGNPSGRPLNKSEPKPNLVQWMPPPDYFTPTENNYWQNLCKELSKMELLSTTDRFALERYVIFLIKWRECRLVISELYKNKFSFPVRGPGKPAEYAQNGVMIRPESEGTIKSLKAIPEIRLLIDISTHLCRLEDRFGLSPSARSRITNDEPANIYNQDGDSDFADLDD